MSDKRAQNISRNHSTTKVNVDLITEPDLVPSKFTDPSKRWSAGNRYFGTCRISPPPLSPLSLTDTSSRRFNLSWTLLHLGQRGFMCGWTVPRFGPTCLQHSRRIFLSLGCVGVWECVCCCCCFGLGVGWGGGLKGRKIERKLGSKED